MGKGNTHFHGWWEIMHTNPKLNKKMSRIAMINWSIVCVTWRTCFLEDSSTCCHLQISVSYRTITRFRQLLMVRKGATLQQHLHWDITIGQKYIPVMTSIIRLSLIFLRMRTTHIYCFTFSSLHYGVTFPMYSGSVMCFNPLIPHGTSDHTKKGIIICSDYVSAKTCNTHVAYIHSSGLPA
jgi:hypothetical protein